MKYFLVVLFCASLCEGRQLLVPSPQIVFKNYRATCLRADYICSFDYITSRLASKPTPNFDHLLDQLDMNDHRSLDNFRSQLIHIVNSEEISTIQLSMLLDVIREMNSVQPSVYFGMIENELRRLHTALRLAGPVHREEFVFIFKRRYPLAKISKLKTDLLKVPLYILHFSSLPFKTDTRKMLRPKKRPILEGECGNERLTVPISGVGLARQSSCRRPTKAEADFESKPELHFGLRTQ